MSTGNTSTLTKANPVKRPATDQVWAWRHNFYDFRKAKRLVEQNRTRDALPYLEGPHAQYVRARFRSIGREDPRFISALALCNAIDPVAHAQQFEPVRETTPPTNQDACDQYGRDLEHFADELTARRRAKGANGYFYQLTRDSQGRDQIERVTPNYANTAIVTGTQAGRFPSTSAAITWAMDNQKRDPCPQSVEDPRETTPPTNQDQDVPVLHVSADIADAFGMHGLPNTVIEPAAPPRANCGKAIVGVKAFRDALKSLRRSIPVIDTIPKGMTDGNGREVKRMVGARRVRFESDGDSVLRLSALDYPDMPAIELTRVAIDSFTHFTIDVETICQIFELSIDDTMSLRVDGSELHIRGSDSHYKLFIDDIADAYALALPSAKLTPTQWLAKALELAAAVTANDADTHKAFDAHLKPATPAARRKLAWAIVKAKPAEPNAYAARVALIAAVGIEKLQKWLTTHIGSPVTLA